MNTITLAIDGMSCGHCVRAVRDALASVESVQVADVAIGSATIQLPEGETPDGPAVAAAIAAVDDAGYPAKVGTPPAPGSPTLHSLGRKPE
jgi:copper chaperone CopZ